MTILWDMAASVMTFWILATCQDSDMTATSLSSTWRRALRTDGSKKWTHLQKNSLCGRNAGVALLVMDKKASMIKATMYIVLVFMDGLVAMKACSRHACQCDPQHSNRHTGYSIHTVSLRYSKLSAICVWCGEPNPSTQPVVSKEFIREKVQVNVECKHWYQCAEM